ncbi:MAG TPA: MBL fold metallo-hydrolase [Sphaerochaeta sp.]|nr:MBL fold metallo-hydrolase [Sphaerochaeta sp.]
MKLLPRVYQVSSATLTHPWDASAYLLDSDDGLYLIDCGTPEGYEACLSNIRSLGYDPAKIKAILGTHGHYDHVGAAAAFKRDFQTQLYLHEADRVSVESGDPITTTASLLYGSTFPPCTVDHLIEDAMVFALGTITITALHTPGHSPGSICFVIETADMRLLVAADTLFGGFSPEIGSDALQWRETLEQLSTMHFDAMSFGHGGSSLLFDVARRIDSAKRSFGLYYVPWFKDFYQDYPY